VFQIQLSNELLSNPDPMLKNIASDFCVAYVPGGGEPSKKFNIYSLASKNIIM
jgi:hypothetical protein